MGQEVVHRWGVAAETAFEARHEALLSQERAPTNTGEARFGRIELCATKNSLL